MEFFLVTTDHLEDRIWFRDAADFRAAMNLMAVVSFTLNTNVLAFILMSNHVHLVLQCDRTQAERFITEFKKLYGRYYRTKYGTGGLLRRNRADIRPLDPYGESLERAIAYVLMNCVAANICASPFTYPWSSASAYFQAHTPVARPLGSLSGRAQIRLLHSKAVLPPGFRVGEGDSILPESYVCVDFVEKLFRSPKRMNYFLAHSSKARERMAAGEDGLPSFSDQTLAAALPELCRSLFGVRSLRELSPERQAELLRQLRFRFSSDVEQLARVSGLSREAAARLLDTP